MIILLSSLIIFFLLVPIQVIYHRILQKQGKASYRTFSIFLLGFPLIVGLQYILPNFLPWCGSEWVCVPLPVTGLAVYGACCANWLILSASPILGDESPSSAIINHLYQKKIASEQKIVQLFSDEELIGKRLADMERSGWIRKLDTRYIVEERGKRIAGYIRWYRQLLGIAATG